MFNIFPHSDITINKRVEGSCTLLKCVLRVITELSSPNVVFLPPASIVTVIRLVNDAVDTIESEGNIFLNTFSFVNLKLALPVIFQLLLLLLCSVYIQ